MKEKTMKRVEMSKHPRNAPCPCGSGKKYKKCCRARDEALERAAEIERIGEITKDDVYGRAYVRVPDELRSARAVPGDPFDGAGHTTLAALIFVSSVWPLKGGGWSTGEGTVIELKVGGGSPVPTNFACSEHTAFSGEDPAEYGLGDQAPPPGRGLWVWEGDAAERTGQRVVAVTGDWRRPRLDDGWGFVGGLYEAWSSEEQE
jgi:hypothetical protein